MTLYGIIAFIAFILGFGFLVFVHELGHFLVAKWVNVKCTQFAIGFGPSILAYRKGIGLRTGSTEAEYERRLKAHLRDKGINLSEHEQQGDDAKAPLAERVNSTTIDKATTELGLGETEYRLNYVPLGGYVKMLGQEDMDPTARSSDPRSFNSRPIWARACVISAGVVMNVIVGMLFFIIAFQSGVEFPPAVVGGVDPDMPAAQVHAQGHEDEPEFQGLQVGDRITHIDGEAVEDMTEVRVATALASPGDELEFTIQRRGPDEPLTYRITPVPSQREGDGQGLLAIGIMPAPSGTVGMITRDSEAHQAGIKPGWTLAAIDGEPADDYTTYYHALTERKGKPVTVTFADPESDERIDVQLRATPRLVQPDDDGSAHLAGFVPPTRILDVVDDSPAAQAGIKPGDLIKRLGDPWPSRSQVSSIVQNAGDRSLSITLQRDGNEVGPKSVTPRDQQLGILMGLPDESIFGQTLPDSPAAALDDPTGGSRIMQLNGQPVESWGDMQRILASIEMPEEGEQREVPVTYQVNVKNVPPEPGTLTLNRAQLEALHHTEWGDAMSLHFSTLREPVVGDNPWQAAKLGVEKTGQFIEHTYITILRLFQGSVQISNLRGPVGIVDEGTQIANRGGWQYMLFFLGLISVNLAVINFLPIPIVDGGHMLFLIVEKIKGSPVSIKVQAAATYVGLALIAFIFLATLFYDVTRLITG